MRLGVTVSMLVFENSMGLRVHRAPIAALTAFGALLFLDYTMPYEPYFTFLTNQNASSLLIRQIIGVSDRLNPL